MVSKDDRCGLDPIVSPRWDPFRKRACRPHDIEFQKKKDGLPHDNLAEVSGDWVRNTVTTALIGAYAVVTSPLYLVGGLLGGAFRWLQIGKKSPSDEDIQR